MDWEALLVVGFIFTLIGMPLLILGRYFSRVQMKRNPKHKELILTKLEVVILLTYLLLIIAPIVLPHVNPIFIFLNSLGHGIPFIVYGISVISLFNIMLFFIVRKGWLSLPLLSKNNFRFTHIDVLSAVIFFAMAYYLTEHS